jgi:DNA-binding NarL/FixJ family response regulator
VVSGVKSGAAVSRPPIRHYGEAMSPPIRVVLVDDHEMVLHGIEAMLARFPQQVLVVGTAPDQEQAVPLVAELAPDVVLCDVRLRQGSGLDVCRAILANDPAAKVVLLTVYDDEQYLYQALRVGASGFLLKRVDGQELVRHLEHVVAGEIVIDPTLAGRVAASAAQLHSGEFWPGARLGLTQRESEVLALLVAGLSNKAIAGRLVVSDDTVKTHIRGVYRKLTVNDRSAAVATALREGLFH